jgi:hypothetical protein
MSGEFPDPELPQDPGIPGVDVVSDGDAPTPDEKDASAEERERPDDPDEEGHMTAPDEG